MKIKLYFRKMDRVDILASLYYFCFFVSIITHMFNFIFDHNWSLLGVTIFMMVTGIMCMVPMIKYFLSAGILTVDNVR
jgi:hypothetical protein